MPLVSFGARIGVPIGTTGATIVGIAAATVMIAIETSRSRPDMLG